MKRFLTLCLSFMLLYSQLLAKEEVDYLQLASLLLEDNHIQRAKEALEKVDLNTTDKPYYFLLKGLIYSKLGKYKEANSYLYKSISLNPDTNATQPLYIYIAQNSFKAKDYPSCIKALLLSKKVSKEPKLASLLAECYWQNDQKEESLQTLKKLIATHPKYTDALKQRFYYFIQLGFYQAAIEDAKAYLARAKENPTILLNFIKALKKSGQLDKAIAFAEKAHLQYPKNIKISIMLAHLYLDKNMPKVAAEILDRASLYKRELTKDSAELYRRAREYVIALLKNAQMLDSKEKYRQRIALYLEYGDYERIIASKEALQRNGLLKDENIRYALAYAYFKEGDFQQAKKLLATLKKPDLIKKAIKLREAMEKCKKNIWECTL